MTVPAGRESRRQPTKDRILRVAAELFARNGYHATSMDDLSNAVGLGRGALYYHIDSKESLLFEISKAHVVEMIELGDQLLASDASATERLTTLCRALLTTIVEYLPEWTVFFREVNSLTGNRRHVVLELRDRFEEIWSETLRRGVEQEEFRSTDPILVKGLLGLFNYSYLWIRPNGRRTPAEIADIFVDAILHGLLHEQRASSVSSVSSEP